MLGFLLGFQKKKVFLFFKHSKNPSKHPSPNASRGYARWTSGGFLWPRMGPQPLPEGRPLEPQQEPDQRLNYQPAADRPEYHDQKNTPLPQARTQVRKHVNEWNKQICSAQASPILT